jgi:hypothetical protein
MPFGWTTYDLWLVNNRFGFNTGGGDIFGISNASAALAGDWHHIAAVFTNSAGNTNTENVLYIDGVEQGLVHLQGSRNNRSVGANFRFSSWTNNTSYTFDGLVDEVRIYDRGLGENEILEDFAITR